MSKASDSGNAVVYAAEQVCALYGVQVTREQSRMFNVQGTAGRWRPMFIGQWTDNFGKIHRAGKADLLARPRVRVVELIESPAKYVYMSVPLWIECKSGTGRLTTDQIAFKNWVESNGDDYLLLHDDVRPLIGWFDDNHVSKLCRDAALLSITDPIDVAELGSLPCRWCGGLRGDHVGIALGCKGKSTHVWSPDLRGTYDKK